MLDGWGEKWATRRGLAGKVRRVGRNASGELRVGRPGWVGGLRRGEVAADGAELSGGEVFQRNKKIQHAAVEEAEVPVVVFVNLKEVDHAGHFLDHFVVEGPAQQLEPVTGHQARTVSPAITRSLARTTIQPARNTIQPATKGYRNSRQAGLGAIFI